MLSYLPKGKRYLSASMLLTYTGLREESKKKSVIQQQRVGVDVGAREVIGCCNTTDK